MVSATLLEVPRTIATVRYRFRPRIAFDKHGGKECYGYAIYVATFT